MHAEPDPGSLSGLSHHKAGIRHEVLTLKESFDVSQVVCVWTTYMRDYNTGKDQTNILDERRESG